MINFTDFVPAKTNHPGLFSKAGFEALESTVKKVNEWIQENDIQVINVETVVLPNIHDPKEEGSADTDLLTYGEMQSRWHQFVRVWHK